MKTLIIIDRKQSKYIHGKLYTLINKNVFVAANIHACYNAWMHEINDLLYEILMINVNHTDLFIDQHIIIDFVINKSRNKLKATDVCQYHNKSLLEL